ncbi:hypothetical protein CRUP_030711 [Coryphaenoides rupestris]|nr:hypothetical protein CRUP_030711 [Coryphaenoides rupestris]
MKVCGVACARGSRGFPCRDLFLRGFLLGQAAQRQALPASHVSESGADHHQMNKMEALLLCLLTVLTGLGELGQPVAVVTVEHGGDVSLACPLPCPTNSTLSWYQRREQRVLLVLSATPTSPPTRVTHGRGFGLDRFTLDHHLGHHHHHLRLLRSQPIDAGVYFCACVIT